MIANQEENRRRDVEKLEAAGIHVWVTYPRTVAEGAALLAELAELGASPEARARVVAPVLAAVAEAEARAAGSGASRCSVRSGATRGWPWEAIPTLTT